MSAKMVWGKEIWKVSPPKKAMRELAETERISIFPEVWKLIKGLQQSRECLIKKNCRIQIRMFLHSRGALTFLFPCPSLQLHGSLTKNNNPQSQWKPAARAEKERNSFKASLPENCHYMTCLVDLEDSACKADFDLTPSSHSGKCLLSGVIVKNI